MLKEDVLHHGFTKTLKVNSIGLLEIRRNHSLNQQLQTTKNNTEKS